MVAGERRRELAANLESVRRRVGAACERAGRRPEEVTVVAVTKTFPASDVRLLAQLGITDIGENRDQEAAAKVAQLAADPELADLGRRLRWHLIGQLQTNKARSVARYADVVHSVDRPRLVAALSRAATDAARTVRCLVQVSLETGDRPPGRGGAPPDAVPELAAAVAGAPGLELAGVMAVAPLGADPDAAFSRLAEVAAAVRRQYPAADWISAGMSADLEAAVAHGATHLRLGRALLGARPSLG